MTESVFDKAFGIKKDNKRTFKDGDVSIYNQLKSTDSNIDKLEERELVSKFKNFLSGLIKNERLEIEQTVNESGKEYWRNLRYIKYEGELTSFINCINCNQILKFDTTSGMI